MRIIAYQISCSDGLGRTGGAGIPLTLSSLNSVNSCVYSNYTCTQIEIVLHCKCINLACNHAQYVTN
jgi:hypothetical protein